MKRLFYLIAVVLIFSGCFKGTEPSDPIGMAAAFSYCATLPSYWVWGVMGTAVAAVILLFVFKRYNLTGKINPWFVFVALAILSAAWCFAPSTVAWNTTVEQAARGVYIR